MNRYSEYLEQQCQHDYSAFAKEHKSRLHTFRFLWDEMHKIDHPVIFELGTTRSFVHGGHEGCMKFDLKYWFPDNPELWDFSAGCFTRVFAEVLGVELHTVDISPKHLWVAHTMTKDFNVTTHLSDSVDFLISMDKQADLIYMDTGDMQPLEPTARLHEREANTIIKRDLLKVGGYILMDDVRNPVPVVQFGEKSRFGKSKYSIGVFLANGYDIVMDSYQMILKRMV